MNMTAVTLAVLLAVLALTGGVVFEKNPQIRYTRSAGAFQPLPNGLDSSGKQRARRSVFGAKGSSNCELGNNTMLEINPVRGRDVSSICLLCLTLCLICSMI